MLQAINLTKRYDATLALDALNLEVQAGEVFCLLGANGAGKTTTLNLFLNFIAPTSGVALVDNIDVAENPMQARRLVAYLPEQVMLYPKLTAAENLDYFSRLAGHRYSAPKLRTFLQQCGLQSAAIDNRLSSFSKGMRQKVGLATALAKQAKALLLDEPTSGLDPQASHEFSGILTDLAGSGMAVLMATHDLFRVKESGTRAGIMRQGRLVAAVNTADLHAADLERLYLEHMAAQAGASEIAA
ncbi:ABC transporter ATP-binding protein [Methylocapsa aurea]|uniref:ABC transporter ATP-binding protein n=1 Tax=Methylocapsa aurea TaxID=663610 RepID=UPI000560DE0C|nr:ABC transporter ATP-binding protein [Methylocapsa aurea]